MKNLNHPHFHFLSRKFFNHRKRLVFAWLAFGCSMGAFAQNTISAAAILEKINRVEKVELDGAIITGDLDFTQLDKKYKGGSYGVRHGFVKEFYTKLQAPLILKNCTLQGAIITRSDQQTPGVLKENFVAFDEEVVFENCRFEETATFEQLTFYQGLTIRNCTFKDDLVFEKVHFSKPPIVEGNTCQGKLVNEKTNWSNEEKQLIPPPVRPGNEVTVILKNPTFRTIEIKFGKTKWSLSPKGESSLLTQVGEEVYLWKDGEKGRLLFTVSRDLDGQTVDVSKL
ncbi:MAG: pentapeptide repeat-containing protein [Saprospiraceae bacterium]